MRNQFGLELTKPVKIGISVSVIVIVIVIIYFVVFYNKKTPLVNLKNGIYKIQTGYKTGTGNFVNTPNTSTINISSYDGTTTQQQWIFTMVDKVNKLYTIQNANKSSNSYLNLNADQSVSLSVYVPYAPAIDKTPATGNGAQLWSVNPLTNGRYTIESSWGSYLSNPYLNLDNLNNINLSFYIPNPGGATNQEWIIKLI